MLPERPNIDAGDSNCQVVKNFSQSPGLTPVTHSPHVSDELKKLLAKHRIPVLAKSGLNLAGSPYWTEIDTHERPHTLLLVIELKEADRHRWRDVDADARMMLREYGLDKECFVRYYIASGEQPARGMQSRRRHPEALMRRSRNRQQQQGPGDLGDSDTDLDMPALIRASGAPWPRPSDTPLTWDHGGRGAAMGRMPHGPQTRRERLDDIADEFSRDVLDRMASNPPPASSFLEEARRADRYFAQALLETS